MDLTACIAPRAIESQSLWSGLRHGVKPSTMREPRALRDVLPVCMCEPALGVPPPNIWKSHPLTRLSGAGRTGVGHRRWVREDTPALRPQTEQRLPSSPASAGPAFPSSRRMRQLALPVTLPSCRSSFSCEAESRGRGGNYFPRMPFLPFLPFCLSCVSFLLMARCGRPVGRRRRVCSCAAFVTKNTLFLHGQPGACVLESRACA